MSVFSGPLSMALPGPGPLRSGSPPSSHCQATSVPSPPPQSLSNCAFLVSPPRPILHGGSCTALRTQLSHPTRRIKTEYSLCCNIRMTCNKVPTLCESEQQLSRATIPQRHVGSRPDRLQYPSFQVFVLVKQETCHCDLGVKREKCLTKGTCALPPASSWLARP